MSETTDTLSERDEVEMLLPWYVTGRLDAKDRARVERWVKADAGLARQLDLIREERDEDIRAGDAMRLPASLTVEKTLVAATRGASPTSALNTVIAVLKALFDGSLGTPLRFAAAAAGALMLVQTAAIGYLVATRSDPAYQTASGGTTATAPGAYALVRFADTATAKDIAAVLGEAGARIIDGPQPGGLYRVRIGAADLPDAARDQRIGALRAKSSVVSFISPTP